MPYPRKRDVVHSHPKDAGHSCERDAWPPNVTNNCSSVNSRWEASSRLRLYPRQVIWDSDFLQLHNAPPSNAKHPPTRNILTGMARRSAPLWEDIHKRRHRTPSPNRSSFAIASQSQLLEPFSTMDATTTSVPEHPCSSVHPPASNANAMSLLSLLRAGAVPTLPAQNVGGQLSLPINAASLSLDSLDGQRTPRTPTGLQRHRELSLSLSEILSLAEEICQDMCDDEDEDNDQDSYDTTSDESQGEKQISPSSRVTKKSHHQPDAQ